MHFVTVEDYFPLSPLSQERPPGNFFELSSKWIAREYDGSRDELARAMNHSVPENRSDNLTFLSGNSVKRIDVITIESYRVPMNRPPDIYVIALSAGCRTPEPAFLIGHDRGIAAGELIVRCVMYAIPRNLARISPKSYPLSTSC